MINILIAVSLSCPKTIIINKTKEWNKGDEQTLQLASKRCTVHFPDAPCLKRFIKIGYNDYQAICGYKK